MRPTGFLLALALPLAPLRAQTAEPDSGARVKVKFAEAGKSRQVTGTLVFRDADSIAVMTQGKTAPPTMTMTGPQPHQQPEAPIRVVIPRAGMSSMQVSAGRHSSVGMGALIGGAVGVAGGVAIGVASLCSISSDTFLCLENGAQVAAVAGITGAGGALIGALVGALVTHEKWVRAGEQAQMSPILLPVDHGAAVGLSIRF